MSIQKQKSQISILKDKQITYLSMLIPQNMKEEVRQNSKHYMMDAANALEWNIYNGLIANTRKKIRIVNLLPVGSYPQYYKKAFIGKNEFSAGACKNHLNVGFCNIKLIRKFSIHLFVYRALDAYYRDKKDPGVLIVYSAETVLLWAVSMLKKKYPSLIVCDIIADLPDMSNLSGRKSFALRMLERYLSSKSYECMQAVDCFVLLTEHMAEYMNIHKPYVVMEGISTQSHPEDGRTVRKDRREINILYSGTLHRRFGILHLLKAFMLTKNRNYRLVICGVGDSEAEIIEAAGQDSRIVFHGQLTREEVLQIQKDADVLVNPRQNIEEFTKYSFPSKNLEYLSAGKPVIAYKLDGIPDEYDEYLHYPANDSIEALSKKIMEICEMDADRRRTLGDKARNFVRDQKNAVVQTSRIVKLISDVVKG